jgi:hypothetical protein
MGSPIPIPQPAEERRRQVRVTFSPVRRPRLRLEGQAAGHLEWPGLGVPVAIAGRVVRVESSEFALRCDDGQLPIAHILAEAARRRDAQDPGR